MRQYKTVAALSVKRDEIEDKRTGEMRPVLETIPAGKVLSASDLEQKDIERFERTGAIKMVSAEEAEQIEEAAVAEQANEAQRELQQRRTELLRLHAEQRREIE